MENNVEKLTDIDIEKAKALFEYEATSLLYALEGREKNVGKDIRNEYLEMEIEKPQFEYISPEFKPGEIGCEAPSAVIELPDLALPPGDVKISGLPEIAATKAFTAPELRADGADTKAVSAAVPKEAAAAGIFSADALFSLPEKTAIPPAVIGLSLAFPTITAPKMEAVPKEASVEIQVEVPDVPEVKGSIGAGVPEIHKVDPVAIEADLLKKCLLEMPDLEPPTIVLSCEAESFVNITSLDRALFELSPVQAPAVDLPAELLGAIKLTDADKALFDLPESEAPKVEIGYEPVGEMSFEPPALPESSLSAPEYPEAPEMPDISASIDDILAAVKADLS